MYVSLTTFTFMMAASRFWPTFCRATAYSWRCYTQPSHNKTTSDYRKFKQSITALRAKYLEEHKEVRKMMVEDQNSQAAQEARKEREREAKALEENEKELQRMAKEREKRMVKLEQRLERKRLRGIEGRTIRASDLLEKRTERVLQMTEMSKNFITMENLEEKIEAALANEMNYNFALSPSGEKIDSTIKQ